MKPDLQKRIIVPTRLRQECPWLSLFPLPAQGWFIFAQKVFAILTAWIDNPRRRTKARSSATWPKTGSSPPSFEFYERVTFCTHRSRHQAGGAALRLGSGETGSQGHHRPAFHFFDCRLVDDDFQSHPDAAGAEIKFFVRRGIHLAEGGAGNVRPQAGGQRLSALRGVSGRLSPTRRASARADG